MELKPYATSRTAKGGVKMRLIDADRFEIVSANGSAYEGEEFFAYISGMDYVLGLLDEAPTIDAVPVRHGKWVNPHWRNSTSCANCSECGFEAQHREYHGVQKYYKLCPNCGAKMD